MSVARKSIEEDSLRAKRQEIELKVVSSDLSNKARWYVFALPSEEKEFLETYGDVIVSASKVREGRNVSFATWDEKDILFVRLDKEYYYMQYASFWWRFEEYLKSLLAEQGWHNVTFARSN